MIEPDFLHTTRTGYDAWAVPYAELFANRLDDYPLDRAMLAAFAEFVRADGGGPVADLGCGPGHVTALLHSLGLTASGVDLSAEMIAIARKAHPELRFEEGSMTALPLDDGELGGILARYSIIHTPPERLPEVFAEFHRVLAPGGHLLLAFQVPRRSLPARGGLRPQGGARLPLVSRPRRRSAARARARRGGPSGAGARRGRRTGLPAGPSTGSQG